MPQLEADIDSLWHRAVSFVAPQIIPDAWKVAPPHLDLEGTADMPEASSWPAADTKDLYRSYVAFKRWGEALSSHEDEAFAVELQRAGVTRASRILEIGFGEGRFLDWARTQGHAVTGVELIGGLVERARERGHDVFEGPIEQIAPSLPKGFDAIVAFDVFEHIPAPELVQTLAALRGVLAAGGRVIGRVPNGGSPFGAFIHAGDITHAATLSPSSIRQIAVAAGYEVVAVGNAARTLRGGRSGAASRRLGYLLRDGLEVVFGKLYYGRRQPLDPLLTFTLRPV